MWGTDFRICIQFFQLFFVEIIQLAGHVTGKRSFPRRAFSRGLSFTPFAKSVAAGYVLFCVPKENQKAPATFEAREARTRGCTPLVTPKQKGSIQKIQVAPLEDFCVAPILSRCATAVRRQQHMPLPVTTFPVKTQCRAVRRPPGIALLYINNSSADDTQSKAARILDRHAVVRLPAVPCPQTSAPQ